MLELLWIILFFLCILPFIQIARRRMDMFSAPAFAGLIVSVIFIWQPLLLSKNGSTWFSTRMAELTTIVAILSLFAFYWGWFFGSRTRYAVPTNDNLTIRDAVSWPRLNLMAVLYLTVGFVAFHTTVQSAGGFLSYWSSEHGTALIWRGLPVYLAAVGNLSTPGILLAIAIGIATRRKLLVLFAALLSLPIWINMFLMANRGEYISQVLCWAVFPLIVLKVRPPRTVYFIAVAVFALSIGFLVVVRPYMHLEADRKELLELDYRESILSAREANSGMEYVYASAIINNAWKTGSCDWGRQWLNYTLTFPLPRVWFPNKDNVIPHLDRHDMVWQEIGAIPEAGACVTGIADVFYQWSFLGLIWWWGLGALSGCLYRLGAASGQMLCASLYTLLLVTLIHIFAQSFISLVNAAAFEAVPLLIAWNVARAKVRTTCLPAAT